MAVGVVVRVVKVTDVDDGGDGWQFEQRRRWAECTKDIRLAFSLPFINARLSSLSPLQNVVAFFIELVATCILPSSINVPIGQAWSQGLEDVGGARDCLYSDIEAQLETHFFDALTYAKSSTQSPQPLPLL
ncbi:hypothetical protein GUJ93_ZPchr0003g18300 [Zizania palustris]|uniref:Uncharacterized protein n=1 Tax=Zizania palustris TaxID=103762 RepID=A0A8J5S6A3_ZIZPA|nr:hypothetical protein GUJ93_ZPchr0003g18300 [Zizania palustris]